MGLDVAEDHFYTSALATAAFLKEQAPGCSVYVIGEAGLYNALYEAGITMNDVNPDYVVVGEGIAYSLDTLTKATNLVLAGAKLIGANSDVSGPIENGISPACGAEGKICGEPESVPIRETDKTEPTNCYGETKLSMEKMFKWVGKAHGFRFVSLRYFNACGAHVSGKIGEAHNPETHLIPLILQVPNGQREAVLIASSEKAKNILGWKPK